MTERGGVDLAGAIFGIGEERRSLNLPGSGAGAKDRTE
jgi:hypothetical protein